jgi:transposase-like protein
VSLNDDRSPLLDMMNCIVCDQAMKLEKVDPDDQGDDIIQYRCKLCGRIERLRLFRRSRV